MKTILVLLGLWVLGTQVFLITARRSVSADSVLTLVAAVGLVIGGVLKSEKRTTRITFLAFSMVMFIISYFVYVRGDWKETYASSMMLRHYGIDPFNLEHREEFQEKLRTGEIDWVDAQNTLTSFQKPPPATFTIYIFKTRRYLRQTFWPPLKYQAWKEEATSTQE